MGLVIHMHQSPDISQTATWSTVNVISNTLFDAVSPLGFAQGGEQQQLQEHRLVRAGPPALPSCTRCPSPLPLNAAKERIGITTSTGERKARFGHTDV